MGDTDLEITSKLPLLKRPGAISPEYRNRQYRAAGSKFAFGDELKGVAVQCAQHARQYTLEQLLVKATWERVTALAEPAEDRHVIEIPFRPIVSSTKRRGWDALVWILVVLIVLLIAAAGIYSVCAKESECV